VWTRRHIGVFEGRTFDQFEKFFVADTEDADVKPLRPDTYYHGYRWWKHAEIVASAEDFAPRRLGELLIPLLEREYPPHPVDCGV
jgi:hypothetical protein